MQSAVAIITSLGGVWGAECRGSAAAGLLLIAANCGSLSPQTKRFTLGSRMRRTLMVAM